HSPSRSPGCARAGAVAGQDQTMSDTRPAPGRLPAMPDDLRRAAEAARGVIPPAAGLALYPAAARYAAAGPVLEIGTYCGKSTIYLACAARQAGQAMITVDHHRGSEENQPGWEYHDPGLVDPATGRLDTLPHFRATLAGLGLDEDVIAIVGRSADVARLWRAPPRGLFFHRARPPAPPPAPPHAEGRPRAPRRLPHPGRRGRAAVPHLPARAGFRRVHRGGRGRFAAPFGTHRSGNLAQRRSPIPKRTPGSRLSGSRTIPHGFRGVIVRDHGGGAGGRAITGGCGARAGQLSHGFLAAAAEGGRGRTRGGSGSPGPGQAP